LQGRLSKSVMDLVTQRDKGLFPKPAEIKMKCSCPDWAGVCKHIAAVMYGIGARLDEKPELLFVLRKVDHLELIAGAVDSAPVAKVGKSRGKKTIATSDLADVFGIEMTGEETSSDAVPAIAKEPAKPRVPATKKVSKKASKPTVTKANKASAAPAAKQSKPKTAKARPQPASPAPAKASSRKRVKQEAS
ncbi:MAG: SWIM zinc finger family protein, partial [Isosphaeraceae bacterium]